MQLKLSMQQSVATIVLLYINKNVFDEKFIVKSQKTAFSLHFLLHWLLRYWKQKLVLRRPSWRQCCIRLRFRVRTKIIIWPPGYKRPQKSNKKVTMANQRFAHTTRRRRVDSGVSSTPMSSFIKIGYAISETSGDDFFPLPLQTVSPHLHAAYCLVTIPSKKSVVFSSQVWRQLVTRLLT